MGKMKTTVLSRTRKRNVIVFDIKFHCEMEIQPCINEWRSIYGVLDMEGDSKFKE
jgi:hypothetical protein